MEKVIINKEAITELSLLTNEVNDRVESLELMSDKKVMHSLKKAKEQINKRKFVDWNAL